MNEYNESMEKRKRWILSIMIGCFLIIFFSQKINAQGMVLEFMDHYYHGIMTGFFPAVSKKEVTFSGNIKSAKKRIKVINTKTERNKAIKTKVKTYIKKVEAAIAANDKVAASEALTACISEISKATSKGIFHKNTASRKIARLSKAVNAIA